jgi:uncharacterized membrane protein (DUF2068 family)
MLACTCWIGTALIAIGVLAAITGLGLWRYRRAQRRGTAAP